MKTKEKIKAVIITTIIVVLVYFALGIIINWIGMTIYFVQGFFEKDDKGYLSITAIFQNNAPLSLPFVNPLFYYSVYLIEGNVSCETSTSLCGSAIIDIKKITAGENTPLPIKILPNNESNFTIIVTTYLNIFNKGLFPESKYIFCVYFNESTLSQERYFCREIVEDQT